MTRSTRGLPATAEFLVNVDGHIQPFYLFFAHTYNSSPSNVPPFLPRDAMQARPAVVRCLCVCLSRSNIPSKLIKISSKLFTHRVAKPF